MAKPRKLPAEYHPEKDIAGKVQDMFVAELGIRDELLLILGGEYLDATERGDVADVQAFLDGGFAVNWQDPESGLTALHIAAGTQARNVLRVLLTSDGCDFLVRDKRGRLPSEVAYLHGEDVAIARLLGNKERKQAEAQGITLTRRPVSE